MEGVRWAGGLARKSFSSNNLCREDETEGLVVRI